MEPNRKCWTIGNFCKTSASYLRAPVNTCHLPAKSRTARQSNSIIHKLLCKREWSRHILIIPLATFSQLGTDVAMSLRIGECSKNGPVFTLPIKRIPSKYRSDHYLPRHT